MQPNNVQLKRKSDSLSRLSSYTGSSSDDEEDNRKLMDPAKHHLHPIVGSSDSETDTDSGSVISLDSDYSDESESNGEQNPTFSGTKPKCSLKMREFSNLPPIEELQISVKEEECEPFGRVQNIIDKLVVIESFPNVPALDMDSVLFKQSGEPLGKIFDIFGPPKKPYYTVRFNSKEEIRRKGLQVDYHIYYSPRTRYTQFVFIRDALATMRSEGSWMEELDPPVDFSEAGEELTPGRKTTKKTMAPRENGILRLGSSHFHVKSFEERMNEKNILRNQMFIIPPSQKKEDWRGGDAWYRIPSRRTEEELLPRERRGMVRPAVLAAPPAWGPPPHPVFCSLPGPLLLPTPAPPFPSFTIQPPVARRPITGQPPFMPPTGPLFPFHSIPSPAFTFPFRSHNPPYLLNNFNSMSCYGFPVQQQRPHSPHFSYNHSCNNVEYSPIAQNNVSYPPTHFVSNISPYLNQIRLSKSCCVPQRPGPFFYPPQCRYPHQGPSPPQRAPAPKSYPPRNRLDNTLYLSQRESNNVNMSWQTVPESIGPHTPCYPLQYRGAGGAHTGTLPHPPPSDLRPKGAPSQREATSLQTCPSN